MPGYPLLLATIDRMGLPPYAVLAAQAVMISLAAMLAYVVGWKLLGNRAAGVVAATLVALHPGAVSATNLITPEPLVMLLVLAGLAFVVSVRDEQGMGLLGAIGGGACLGLVALVQPLLVLLGPLVALWALFSSPRWRTLTAAACLLVCSLTPAGLWLMRNDSVGFGYRLSSAPAVEAWFFTAAYMDIQSHEGNPEAEWVGVVNSKVAELASELNPQEDVVAAAGRLALERVQARPDLFTQVLMQGTRRYFMSHSLLELHQQVGLDPVIDKRPVESLMLWLSGGKAPDGSVVSVLIGSLWVILNTALATLMIIGCFFMFVRRQWSALALLLGVGALFILSTQFIGLERARLPILALQGIAIAAVFLPDPLLPERLARKAERRAIRDAKKAKRARRKPKVDIEPPNHDAPLRISRGPLAAMAAVEPGDPTNDDSGALTTIDLDEDDPEEDASEPAATGRLI